MIDDEEARPRLRFISLAPTMRVKIVPLFDRPCIRGGEGPTVSVW